MSKNIWRYRKLAQKKSYSRYFIILQEDEKGYSISSDKVASGYAKLEMKNDKCKISYYVQNLKKESAPYYMLLICNKKEVRKVIKISQMNIDDYGRADVYHEYSADNIAGTGISMDKISGAAIVKFLDSNIIPVMSGFASTAIPDWKTFTVVDLQSIVKEEERPLEAPNSMFDKYEENIESLKEEKKTKEIEKVKNTCEEDNIKKEQNINKKENIKENIKENVKENVKEQIKEKESVKKKDNVSEEKNINKPNNTNKEKNSNKEGNVNKQYNLKKEDNIKKQDNINGKYKNTPRKGTTKNVDIDDEKNKDSLRADEKSFFENLVQDFECLGEICSEIKRCKWYKIPVDSQRSMYDMSNYNKYTMLYYPMINYYSYIKKYEHYLIGYKLNKESTMKYLIYAIPGTKNKMDQPYVGKSGFVTWMPLNSEEDEENSLGYWLMFYDFKTSTIIIPVKK
jgi:outer membrane biosynthesis protein TonB